MFTEHTETVPEAEALSRRLAAYIPVTLAGRLIEEGLPPVGEVRTLQAATIFSDISGFTAMSAELAADGPRGAEELNRVLLLTFTGMIDLIHQMRGAVSHFYGDAMSVYFPDDDGRAGERALASAQMLQQLVLTSFDRIVTNRPPGQNPFFELTIKIGVGYGQCQEIIVGSAASSLEFVLRGAAVDEAAEAEKQASSGQVIASRSVLAQAGLPARGRFAEFTTQLQVPKQEPILNWALIGADARARLLEHIPHFVPRALYQRMLTAGPARLAEHRPVTSVFVQFETGEEGSGSRLAEQLQEYYLWASRVVARFGSRNARINRLLTADKGNQLHIIFGAPIAPDSPEQAIRCALALQRERPPFITSQRIGLAAGKVFACPVGATSRREYTVVGDVVNLSARLTQVCDDGDVVTDGVTAERVRDLIDFEQLTAVQLKGRETAVPLYRPTGDRAMTVQLEAYFRQSERPLVGRDSEIDLLLGGMDAALRGIGGAAAMFGPTGVGKTRLMAVGVKHWLEAGGSGLVGVCHQHMSEIPLGPWRSIWIDFFGLQAGEDPQAQAALVVNRTRALVPDCGDDVGLWGEVLGLPIPQAKSLSNMTAAARQARLFSLARRCFRAASMTQPLLIILESVHWADQSSLELIDLLTQRLEEWPIFLALTFRQDQELDLETLSRPCCVPIIVSDLPPRHARRLLQQMIGTSELPPAVEQHLGLRDRDGRESPVSPLFLEEALNVMITSGVLRTNGRVQVNESLLARVQLPDTIHGLLLARIDRLPPASRDLLQVASVIGRQFALEALNQITPDTPRQLVFELLTELSQDEITQLVTADPEWIYLFQHAMTHEVAYESLPFSRRQALHAAVADWLAARHQDNLRPISPVLAFHYSRAGMPEEGLKYALAAADDARDIFANNEAVELYRLAETHLQRLGEQDHWDTVVDLCLSRGSTLLFTGDFKAAVADAEKAAELSLANDDIERAARAYNLMSDIKFRQARYDEVQKLAKKITGEWAEQVSPNERARAYQWLGMAASSRYELDIAHDALREAERICLEMDDRKRHARVLEAIAYVYYIRRDLEKALEAMQASVRLSRDFSIPANIASALNNIALIQTTLGQPEAALETVNEAIDLLSDYSPHFAARFLNTRVVALTHLGHYERAYDDLVEALDQFVSMQDEFGMTETYLLWGSEYSCALGDWQDARFRFEKAEELICKRPADYPEERIHLLLGQAHVELQSGSVEKAKLYLGTAERWMDEREMAWWRPLAGYLSGLIKLKLGEREGARQALEEARVSVANEGSPDYLPLILLELARLANDDDARLRLLADCVRAARHRARFCDRMICLKAAGSLLAQSDNPELVALGKSCLEEAAQWGKESIGETRQAVQ
ncbi:MAG: AAA family ATPase [Anaerolineae bacterium]